MRFLGREIGSFLPHLRLRASLDFLSHDPIYCQMYIFETIDTDAKICLRMCTACRFIDEFGRAFVPWISIQLKAFAIVSSVA